MKNKLAIVKPKPACSYWHRGVHFCIYMHIYHFYYIYRFRAGSRIIRLGRLHFLAVCPSRRLNQGLLVYVCLSWDICFSVFHMHVLFVRLFSLISTSAVDRLERLRNDLLCGEWNIKPYY